MNNIKIKKINKVSNKRSLIIMATWPIAVGVILGFSYLTYTVVESKYFTKVDKRSLLTTDLNQKGIELTNQKFANIIDKLELDKDFAKYSASQILNLVHNSQSNFRLINLFNLADFSSKYPFLKLNINPIDNSDVDDKKLITKVVNNNLVNVLFSAHDQLTNKVYSKVRSIRGFEGKGETTFVDFNLDQQKSSFILSPVEIAKKWNATSLIDSLNNEYKKTKDTKKTLEKYGSFLLLDSNNVVVDFPEKTTFDFQTDSTGNIVFKNLEDSTGNLWVAFDIFDGKKQKIRSFDLKVLNLLNYREVTNYLNNLLKNNDDLIVLKEEKIEEIVAKNVSLSTFFISSRNIKEFFDTSKLDTLFTNSLPNFGLKLFAANSQMDRFGEVELMVQVDFRPKKELESNDGNQKTASNVNENSETETKKASENKLVLAKKVEETEAALFQDSSSKEKSENKNTSPTDIDSEVQLNYHKFNFIYNLKPFKNLAQRYLNSVIKNNDYYIIKNSFNYLTGSEIINNLKAINASFYSFVENKNTNKGYEIVNLESSPTYDSLASQQAIVLWFIDFFKDKLDFPDWKKAETTQKPEEILAKIFEKMNNIINSKQIFSYGVKYNLFFDNLTRELQIKISIQDKTNKILGQKVIKISGLAPVNPPLFVAKQNFASFFIDGSGGFETNDPNILLPKTIKNLKSITNPQVLIATKNEKNGENNAVNIKMVQNSGVLYPSLNGSPLAFVYRAADNSAFKPVEFEIKKPFFYGFSVQNNLEYKKYKVVLNFVSETKNTIQNMQTNSNENHVIWVKKVANKTELVNKNGKNIREIPENFPVWVVGISKKNEIDAVTSVNGRESSTTPKIIGILPVSEGNFTNFVISYNGFSEKSSKSQTNTNNQITLRIASERSKNLPALELVENDLKVKGTSSSTTEKENLSIILGDSENSKNGENSEVLFRFFIQFDQQFQEKQIFDLALENSLK
ncbi:P110/LppT family adhesin N-terminal domain [Mesomycoplasma flocculare]|uniref:P110/LppT family adhesin N-terminal domain n=1 Tax=Mesomycoplasma flocculare TaxID=2128 RepID=UPI00136C81A9|nr:P110/LppT family adhesin N-terminal domain [Mesomycoplasma flocculare]MXR05718.1 hypothetical protein [Mesomycoplasma flocculare]